MYNYQFYHNKKPKNNELVLINVIEQLDSYFKVILLEYNIEGILNFKDATKKKKIKNWKSIIQLNKNMVAKIEDIDDIDSLVQLSLINLYTNKEITQETLLVYFNENKLMEKFINSYCINMNKNNNNNNIDFTNIWYNIIHNIDKNRVEYNYNNQTSISLWSYFINNINNLDIPNDIIVFYNNKYINNKNNHTKIISKFSIISTIGISHIKNIFNEFMIINNLSDICIKIDTTPCYILYSNDITLHNNFIVYLKNQIETKYCNLLFLKIESIGTI